MNYLTKLYVHNQENLIKFSWLIPILFWAILYIYRPFLLGFYHDDWHILVYMPLKFYAENYPETYPSFPDLGFYFFINFYSNRPLTGITCWLLSLICHDSPFKWHCAVIITNMATAWSIRLLVRKFLTLIHEDKAYLGDIAATFWLVFPWSMAINTWPTLIPNQLTIICFSLSGCFLFTAWSKHKIGWFLPALFFLLSCLSYESFYGQFIIYIIIGFIYRIHKQNTILALFLPLLSFGFAQGAVILFNRFGGVFIQHSVRKTLNKDWPQLWLSSLQNLPETLLQSLTIFKSFFIIIILIGIFIFIFACVEQIIRYPLQRNKSLFQAIFASLAFILGGIIAVAIYSIAGYAMTSIGVESRVTLSLSFWITLVLVSWSLVILKSRLYIRRVSLIITLSGLLCLSGATMIQLQSWIKSWETQQQILRSAPLNKVRNLKNNTYIVLNNYPDEFKGVTVFQSDWDFNSAMNYTYSLPSTIRFLLQRETLVTTWNGETIQQTSPGNWEFSYEADEVWVWNYKNKSFKKAIPPFQIP